MLGVGGANKTYLDDVFSTYLYTGNASNRSINNGIDLDGQGGFVWIKNRDASVDHNFYDTERGVGKYITSNTTDAEQTSTPRLNAFNNNGFGLGGNSAVNDSGTDFTSFSFRKSPGFCDVVTYTGTGTSTNADGHLDVNHQLGSIPGMVIVKRTSGSSNWWVFHRGMDNNSKSLFLQSPTGNSGSTNYWNNTSPTATQFTVGEWLNSSGSTYVAYVFAGGESPAAYGLGFNGNGEYLEIADHADFDVGTNWTAECWFYPDSIGGNNGIFSQWDSNGTNGYHLSYIGTNLYFYTASTNKVLGAPPRKQWHHVAISKEGSTTRIFLNGTQVVPDFDMGTVSSTSVFRIGRTSSSGIDFNGEISNLRIVKGTAVYTSSFIPSTQPLTNITNTKLLCCNTSTATGSTVTPGTITQVGNGGVKSASPFDDPAGFIFGDDADQAIIKCGSYKGESSHSTRLEVNLGFEPQWVLIKNSDSSKDWVILDNMRRWEGDADNVNVSFLVPNSNGAESDGQMAAITPTGFICQSSSYVNGGSDDFVYMAIRRLDPLVQKPVKLGTDVFAMDTGDGNPSALPSMDSTFPVDFGTIKLFASNQGWYTGSRLTGSSTVFTNTNDGASNNSILKWDSNEGFWKNLQSTYQGWMWKRHAGFDCIFYKGDAVTGRVIRHNLSKTPEMIWIKKLDQAEAWAVGHKDLDGGNEPWTHYLQLESTASEQDYPLFNDQAPSSHQFAIHQNDMVNGNSHKYVAMLFASTAVSKVGSYSGSGGSGNAQNIGFQPRFLMVKRVDSSGAWYVFDSLRTTSNPFRYQLELNTPNQQDFVNKVTVSSTGWSFIDTNINESGSSYIYYAHA